MTLISLVHALSQKFYGFYDNQQSGASEMEVFFFFSSSSFPSSLF